ncbi:TorD/DmsD family molecular chaperone [Neobacillus vireti]|uniref:TorD/DmsD family molecular chaperone n=1 Tax=Neobacillus vireti TaxID=220686 RepID=UPI002FFDF748
MYTNENTIVNESQLIQSRLYLNQLIRFFFDLPPHRKALLDVSNQMQFQSLCKISDACGLIQKGIQLLHTDNGEYMKQLQAEYNRLFVGPNMLPAPLWESVYLGQEHLLFKEITLAVRECYHQYGLSFIREGNEPEDHIVIELEFLSFLIQKTVGVNDKDTKSKWLDEKDSFLTNHLLKCGPHLCEIMSKSTSFELYKGTALLLGEYLSLESELIQFLKEALKDE